MSNEASKRPDDAAGSVSAEQSLTDALNSLEKMLERRRGTSEDSAPTPSSEEPTTRSSPSTEAREDGQYTIPLLDQVVVPRDDISAVTPTRDDEALATPGEEPEHEDDGEFYRRLVERLANELEVIVHSRVEAALTEAAEDIREQVRNHIEIVLPEILEDLVHTLRQKRP